MKAAIVHTDFRLYWRNRLEALNLFLNERNIQFFILEVSLLGSNYSFEKNSSIKKENHFILFPDHKIEDLHSNEIVKKIISQLDIIQPDIVIAGPVAFPAGAGAVKWASEHKKKLIIFDDARKEDVRRNFIVNFIKKIIFLNADAVFIPAPSHSQTYREFGFSDQQIFFGVDVIDNAWFSKKAAEAGKNRKNPVGSKFLLFAGRQVAKKNLRNFLEAFISYQEANKESSMKLVIVGEGPENQNLRSIANENVLFFPFMQQDEIIVYYAFATALVLPSYYGETWGLVLNEAMAAGLPVIASRECGATSTLIRSGINGYSFNPHDQLSMTGAIRKIDIASQDELDQMGEASRKIIRNWDLDRFCDGLYQAILFASSHKKHVNYLSVLAAKLWKGRYRPT